MAADRLTLTQLRRDRRAIWWWLPIGGMVMWLVIQGWQHVAGEPAPPGLYTALDLAWIAVTVSLIARRSSARCPKCDHRYLRGFPWQSLKKVECGVCGHEIPEA